MVMVLQNYKLAFSWYEKSAMKGNSTAQSNLAYMYLNGESVTVDYSKAKYWCEKAVAKGDAVAQYLLGTMYAEAKGVEESSVRQRNCLP